MTGRQDSSHACSLRVAHTPTGIVRLDAFIDIHRSEDDAEDPDKSRQEHHAEKCSTGGEFPGSPIAAFLSNCSRAPSHDERTEEGEGESCPVDQLHNDPPGNLSRLDIREEGKPDYSEEHREASSRSGVDADNCDLGLLNLRNRGDLRLK